MNNASLPENPYLEIPTLASAPWLANLSRELASYSPLDVPFAEAHRDSERPKANSTLPVANLIVPTP